jgi:hypothetical protein
MNQTRIAELKGAVDVVLPEGPVYSSFDAVKPESEY